MAEKGAPPPPGFVTDGSSSSTPAASAPPAVHTQPNVSYPKNLGNAPYEAPPPSYQNAMEYPSAAPPYMTANPAPNATAAPYPPQPAFYAHPNITITTLPQPPQPPQQPPATQRVVVQVTTGPGCTHCGAVMRKESDICCILCLVLLTLFTFPVGLLFLCCLPCAVQMRCPNCGRTN